MKFLLRPTFHLVAVPISKNSHDSAESGGLWCFQHRWLQVLCSGKANAYKWKGTTFLYGFAHTWAPVNFFLTFFIQWDDKFWNWLKLPLMLMPLPLHHPSKKMRSGSLRSNVSRGWLFLVISTRITGITRIDHRKGMRFLVIFLS